jgi:tetratricopeptide (TPR) repeat protein
MIIGHSTLSIRTEFAMATPTAASATSGPTRTQVEPFFERAVVWGRSHKQLTSWIGVIVVVGLVLFVWNVSSNRRSEEVASRELQGARFAYENQNMPLAASELARITENYSGTNAAQEGRLLLAQVRLLQGQPQQAVQVLQDFAGSAGKAYRAQAYGLLAGAYENLGRFREAGEAYENGSAAAGLDFLKAQLLSDAGRAWATAGDTTRAVAAYRRIVDDFGKEGTATEARVRLGELTKGTVSQQ